MKTLIPLLFTVALTTLVAGEANPSAGTAGQVLAAQAGEKIILPELHAIVLLAAGTSDTPAASTPGIHLEQVPILDGPAARQALQVFLGRPVSMPSLGRIETVIRVQLGLQGRPFARIYTPPQDITDGAVRIVVQLASIDGEVRVDGNRWFARERYIGGLRARPGEPLDTVALATDLAWLNRNPFRRVTPVIEPGARPGTTRVTLRTEEQLPLSLSAGYSNTGTPATDEDRVSASVQWGNALGRGDLLDVGLSGDPAWEHMRSYNAGYTAFLPWRHVLTLFGAYSSIDSVMPEPFTQSGTSWQVGARYEIPLAAPRPGWTQNLSFSADFKYSDNTLEFAAIPVTGNVTHIAQAGVSYDFGFPALGGRNDVRLEAVASPGGLTARNGDRAFSGSRVGAKADYAYARLGLRHQHGLRDGWSLAFSTDAQFSTGALLGTEQLNGGGSYAVRGYRESSAFGDWGVVGSAELHAPAFAAVKGRDRVDVFVFLDAASLRLHVDDDGTDLASAGLGLNYQFARCFSLRAAYGWQLEAIASSRGVYSGYGHVSANVMW